MDVNCTRCGASYELEEGLASAAAMTVKCTQCGHLFKVQRAASDDGFQESGSDDATTHDEMSRWRVRRADGTHETLESLAELASWIGAGRIARDDEISRTGQMWRRLGDIAELATFFESAQRPRRNSDPGQPFPPLPVPPPPRLLSPLPPPFPPASDRPSAPPPQPMRERHSSPPERRFQVMGADVDVRPEPPQSLREGLPEPPAKAVVPVGEESRREAPPIEAASPRKAPSLLVWILLIAAALGAAAAVAGVFSTPERIPRAQESPARAYLAHADDAFSSQRPLRFDEAISEYTKALAFHSDDPHILSSLSRVYAVWSQWLRFRILSLTRGATGAPDEVATLEREARRLAEQAKLYGERAAQQNPGNEEASVALSDALRLTGNLVGARTELDRVRRTGGGTSAEALRVAALLAIDEAGGELQAGRVLATRAAIKDPTLIHVRFLLALCLIATGDLAGARAELDAITTRDPDHPARADLIAALGDAKAPKAPRPAPKGTRPTEPDTAEDRPAKEANPAELVHRAEQALERGQVQTAERLFEQALQAQPELPRALTGLGYVALERSQPTLAISRFRPAAKRGNPEAWIGLGDSYRRLGRMADALQAYRTYLQRFPRGSRASIAQRQVELLTEQLGGAP